MSRRNTRMRLAFAFAALVLLAGVAVAIAAARSGGSGASASKFHEPSVSPSCVPSRLNVSAALAGARVTVSPEPDSRDASVATQISMLGPPASALAEVTVSGSSSGAHTGRLVAYSQGDGASFVPSKPFTQGETVTVHAELREGARTIPFAWRFTAAVQDHGGHAGGSARPAPQQAAYQSFRSRPDLRPPTVAVTTHAPGTAPGEIFLAPYSGPGQYGPMILAEDGSLLWFDPLSPSGTRAADFRVQQYEGKPVLTWWQDPLSAGGSSKSGEVIMDSSYRRIAVVRAGNGYQPDLHEFQITPRGVGIITVYDGIDCDLSSVGGATNAAVADTLFQEIDLKTGAVMYEWHSLDHVPLSDSYASPKGASRTTPFDFFHINAVDVRANGELLVDARNTWAAYDVDPRSGQIRWRLGGKRSSFTMGAGTRTAWQHDAREQPDGTFTFFDNGATPAVHSQSRALQVRVDAGAKTVTLVREQPHPATPLLAGSQGNVQALANGSWIVGWGEEPYFSEFGANGQLLLDAHLPATYESYRTYRLPWSGRPSEPPALSIVRAGSGGGATVYASWNGATEVVSWRVLAGATTASLAPVGGAARSGFETAIALPSLASGDYVELQALNAAGAVIGASAAKRA
ncbi:MAG TPA: arylsulfotransferase family protein [Solirubrobacteraceae bacterium]|nr:arylsulfotransferase family protein [Solirubrobacteraceae bacterium]